MPRRFIHAVCQIKGAAARVNVELGLLDRRIADSIQKPPKVVRSGVHDDQFPIDVFQTGSGTSTNMNANEVLATLASRTAGRGGRIRTTTST